MIRLREPLEGTWLELDFPPVVTLMFLNGTSSVFRRTRLAERHPGCVAQYREHRQFFSMHLHVHDETTIGRRWIIDHQDEHNPDFGAWRALRHFFADHPLGRILLGR